MKCTNCGAYIKQKNQQYCIECGQDVSKQIQKHNKKRKKTLLFTGIPVVLAAGLVIAFFIYGNTAFSPQNTIDDFSEAVEDDDADTLANLLTSNDDSFSVDENNALILSNYLSENDGDKKAIVKNLEEQADSLDDDDDNEYMSDENYAALQIKEDGSKWGFFNDYKLNVTPGYIEVNSRHKGIDIFINDDKVATTPEDKEFREEFGPFMPGTYTIRGTLDTPYANAEKAEKVDLFNTDKDTKAFELAMAVGKITVISSYDDANLYLNGEKTDVEIGHGTQVLGPFSKEEPLDVKVVQEMPWGSVESETKTVTKDGNGRISFDMDSNISDEEEEHIFKTVNDVLATYTDAITESDASLLEDNVTENFKEDLKEKIKEVDENNPDYEGKLVKTKYDSKWYQDPEYNKDRGAYMFELTLHLIRHETNGDHLGDAADYDEEDHTKYKRTVTMLFDEENDEWKVDSMKTSYGIIGYDDFLYELD